VLFYGDPETGQHRAIMAHCNRLSVMNCYFQDFHEEGRDVSVWPHGTADATSISTTTTSRAGPRT
jgi:hypothetical protein